MAASEDSYDARFARLEAKLAPHRIRATLAFAGLFQLTHELIKRAVVDDTAGFFGKSISTDTWWYGEDDYKAAVLSLSPKSTFKASLLWLVNGKAITAEQAERLDAIYGHRHDLTHGLIKYIVDVDFEPDMALFLDALSILGDIRRFWTEVEAELGTFDKYGITDLDEVTPLSLAVLSMCIDAYAAGLGEGSTSASGVD